MAFQFPTDKNDFTAANGITYTWDVGEEKWRVKAFRSQDDLLVIVEDSAPADPKEGDLWWDSSPDSLTLFVYEGTAWVPAAPPVSLDDIRQDIIELEEKVDELSAIIKGSVARYIVKNTSGVPVSRPGEVSTNTGFYSNITTFSFGTADADGEPTKTMVNGNIIETFDAAENKTNRFSITDASGAPTLVSVKYVSGNLFYAQDNEIEVNIY